MLVFFKKKYMQLCSKFLTWSKHSLGHNQRKLWAARDVMITSFLLTKHPNECVLKPLFLMNVTTFLGSVAFYLFLLPFLSAIICL